MLRRAVPVLLSLLVALAAAPAEAGRARSNRPAPAAGKPRLYPKKLGEGFMSKAFLSRDGRHVIKKVKPTLGGVRRLSRERRARLASRSVAIMDVVRREGLPVPNAVVPAGHPGMIVQELASEGTGFGELRWSARPRALASAFLHYVRAVRAVRAAGFRGVLVDPKIANFKFAPDGRVVSWFDPAGVGGPLSWIALRSQMLARRVADLWRRGR